MEQKRQTIHDLIQSSVESLSLPLRHKLTKKTKALTQLTALFCPVMNNRSAGRAGYDSSATPDAGPQLGLGTFFDAVKTDRIDFQDGIYVHPHKIRARHKTAA